MKISVLLLSLSWLVFAGPQEVAHHPAPKDPFFLTSTPYADVTKQVVAPPAPGSSEQRADEEKLHRIQSSRTKADCERAESEVYVSPKGFFGSANGPLDDASTEKLGPFFERIRNDGDFFIQRLKKDFGRKRPFLYIEGLEPCVKREVTFAYPSGHATLARLYARILADLIPSKKEALLKRADSIAEDRVIAGVHHPTDIEAGKKLGDLLYNELSKSKKYLGELQEQRALLKK